MLASTFGSAQCVWLSCSLSRWPKLWVYILKLSLLPIFLSRLGPWDQGISHVRQSCHLVLVKLRHTAPKNWIFLMLFWGVFVIFWLSKLGMDTKNSRVYSYWLISSDVRKCVQNTLCNFLLYLWLIPFILCIWFLDEPETEFLNLIPKFQKIAFLRLVFHPKSSELHSKI